MGTPANRAYQVAADVLAEVVAALEAVGNGAPERRYVNDGQLVAWDCEQVATGIESIFGHTGALADDPTDDCLTMRAALVQVWIVRCSPTLDDAGQVPAPAEIDASARVTLSDPLVAMNAITDAYRDGRITGARGLQFIETSTAGPDGGYVGSVSRFRIDLTTAVM